MLPNDLQFAPKQEEGERSPGPPREGKSLGSLAHSASRQNLGGAREFLANKSSLVRCCDREKTWLFSRLRTRYPQAYRPKRRCRGQKTGKCCGLRDEPTLASPHASFAVTTLPIPRERLYPETRLIDLVRVGNRHQGGNLVVFSN